MNFQISTTEVRCTTLSFHWKNLLKNIAVSFAMSLDSINSNIEFTSKISLNSDNYTGDKIKLEEVILNLLQNAKDAVSEKKLLPTQKDLFFFVPKKYLILL